MIFKTAVLTGIATTLLAVVSAHPGERHDEHQLKRDADLRHAIADLHLSAVQKCSSSEDVQARRQRAMERRLETFKRLRSERSLTDGPYLHRRDTAAFTKWSQVSHDQTSKLKFSSGTPAASVFGSNTTCVFTPDNADGPYFVQGEQIRSNVTENLVGVPIHMEMQFIDVNTCRPAENLFIDIWSCNSTGAYSGVSAAGEGGLESTYLRGVQVTNKEGVVNFDSIFPGHYQGRATHQHITAHAGAQVLPNGSYTGGHVAHLSQFFFDQALVNLVEATAPYKTNTIPKTPNAYDMFTGYSATAAYDPFPDYIMLGGDIQHGLFMWMEVGLNTTYNLDYYAPPASYVDETGTHDNPLFAYYMILTGFPPPTHG
ncbi:putative gpi anchored dioxygenase [Diplogelasinospora grovesii]|uniref:Gpi anchored dioxygenase n=1 Tax=Diplogelasinospora grovesii TaxID=303347 RepID=A0AAN6N1J5_9PEZI|nr:putative gpi anchored dioxygenase [Diplogelasinospora grovesii]